MSRTAFPGSELTSRRVKCHITSFIYAVSIALLSPSSYPAQPSAPSERAAAGLKEGVQALFAGDYAGAEAAANRQLAIDSRSVEALVLLARAQMAQGKYPLAFSSLRRALGRSPDHVEALYFMGKLASALSQMEYQELAQRAPGSGRVRQLVGDSYQASGELDKALDEYRAALVIQPDLTDVALELAEILRTQGRFEEALKYYSQILERSPRHFPSLYGAGLCHQALQQEDQSIRCFEQAAIADPKDASCRYALGTAWMRKGEAHKAVEVLTAAVHLDPSLWGAYSLLGRALLLTGQPEMAAEAFEKAKQGQQREVQSQHDKAKKVIGAPVKN
ncbi:MAG: tetratricopeptide repeat protein [Acidobacteria bacterium]|nr:tetratricopeptide repeat protein [Acidobacteriota bacterium]